MTIVTAEYLRVANEKMGGVNPAALDSLIYWNNPLALKHWTMNVVELLMIAGAVMAFFHARRRWRERGDPSNLCLFWASIVYLFVSEVPLYFPHLLGLDIGFVFTHNEFSVGILYNQTPLYIVALYPALLCPSYALVQQTGLLERRGGIWLGALCVGFVHSCFYEIFDHFGPQYTWWVWNFDNPLVSHRLASVPWSSVIVFSLTPPMVATVLVRGIASKYAASRQRRSLLVSKPTLIALTLLIGVLLPVINGVLPTASIPNLASSSAAAITAYASVLGVATAASLGIFVFVLNGGENTESSASDRYPLNFFRTYLFVFLGLWIYALPEYFAAQAGLTARATPVGYLPYVVCCFVACGFVLYRSSAVTGARSRDAGEVIAKGLGA